MTPLTLTQADDGRAIDLVVGAVVRIELPENPTTGYRWALGEIDDAVVALRGEHYRGPKAGDGDGDSDGSGDLAGGGGLRVVELAAVGAGLTSVAAQLRRAWEPPDAAIARFAVVLAVADA
jgi:inhibitor of cysteine peptidase